MMNKHNKFENKAFDKLPLEVKSLYNDFLESQSKEKSLSPEMSSMLDKIKHSPHTSIAMQNMFIKVYQKTLSAAAEHDVEKDLHQAKMDLSPELMNKILSHPEDFPLSEATKLHISKLSSDGKKAFLHEYKSLHRDELSEHHSKLHNFIEKIWHDDILPILKTFKPLFTNMALKTVALLSFEAQLALQLALPKDIGGVVDLHQVADEFIKNGAEVLSNKIEDFADSDIIHNIADDMVELSLGGQSAEYWSFDT